MSETGDFEQFLGDLREPGTEAMLSPQKFAVALGIDLPTVAAQAHVQLSTVLDAPDSPTLQRFLSQAIRVIRAATELSGDLRSAIFWYRNQPLAVLGHQTAEQLVVEGTAEKVLLYVSLLEAGASG